MLSFIIKGDLSMDFDDIFDDYENDSVASSSDSGLLDEQGELKTILIRSVE